MLRYAITDRRMFAGDERARRAGLVDQAQRLAAAGVDFLQIREKDLPREEMLELSQSLRDALHAPPAGGSAGHRVKLLLNVGGLIPWAEETSRRAANLADLLREALADGLHLPGGWTAPDVNALRRLGIGGPLAPLSQPYSVWSPDRVLLSVACHSTEECTAAARTGADLILFGPVFGKVMPGDAIPLPGAGLGRLRDAVAAAGSRPILALGGVTAENTAACLEAGAAGVAGIRLFA